MIDLGLTAAERRAFRDALLHSYSARTRFTVLDRDEQPIGEAFEGRVLTGQVDFDASARPDRSLQLTFADDDRRFRFVPSGAHDATLFADNFLRVERRIRVRSLERWIDVPLFTGPIISCSRDGREVRVQAVGKEALGLEPALAWTSRPSAFGKGTRVVDAIREIMRATGERRFDLPNLTARLGERVSLSKSSQPWRVCRRLAAQANRQLYYDGEGRLRMRPWPTTTAWTFKKSEDEGGNVTTRPRSEFLISEVRNVIEVLGPEPEGKEPRLRVVVMPPRGHPLSPWSLARNGQPRFLVETVELGAKKPETLRKAGERLLRDRLEAAVHVEFDAWPAYHLEPGDRAALVVDDERTVFRLRQYSMPLGGEAMTVGYHKRSKRRGKK